MVTRRAVGVSADEGEPGVSPVPSSIREALVDPHWRRAKEEYAALLVNQTWDLVPSLSGGNVVTDKWISTCVRLTDLWSATRLVGFFGASPNGLESTTTRASVQW